MPNTLPDAFDSYVKWFVLFFFLTAVNLAMEAGAYLVDGGAAEALRAWAVWPTRAGMVAIAIAVIVWLRVPRRDRQHRAQRALCSEYAIQALKRSALVAFALTFVALAFLDIATNNTQLPADFFIKLPGVTLSAGFSVSFFLFSLGSGDGESKEVESQ